MEVVDVDKSKKRIGLVTLCSNNFGSILQCYATQRFVESKGYLCDLLCKKQLTKTGVLVSKSKKVILHLKNAVLYPGYISRIQDLRTAARSSKNDVSSASLRMMNDFTNGVLRPMCLSPHELKELSRRDEYICFLAGSDQVWNGSFPYDPFFFLDFAPQEKRVAWAPSFGTSVVEDYNVKAFTKSLLGFSRLSSREESGIELIEKLSGRKAQKLLDPVTLLSRHEWESFSKCSAALKKRYILVHFLNKPNTEAIRTLELLHGSEDAIISIAYPHQEFDEMGYISHLECGPVDYVSLINGASLVLTDSFHTSLFSIILETPFLVFERSYLHQANQKTRLLSLLDTFNISNRLTLDAPESIADISFAVPKCHNELAHYQLKASRYFDEAVAEAEKVICENYR